MKKKFNLIDNNDDYIVTGNVLLKLTESLLSMVITTGVVLALILTGCHGKEADPTTATNHNLLVVERQTIDLDWDASITVDAPIAQTESFVTYGIEEYHYGDSCGSEFYCHTFSKNDGHRIQNIISWDDILHFINDHSDAKHPFEQWQLESKNIDSESLFDAGLTENGLLVVNEDEVNHYVLGMFAYEDVLPYLSREAQELVKAMVKTKKYNREDWYVGRCIGQVGNTLLMPREPQWQGFANFNCVDDTAYQCDKVYSLSAYAKTGDQYIPQKIFDLKAEKGTRAQRKRAEEQLKQEETKPNMQDYLYIPARIFPYHSRAA